jgi:hypothetical protein
MWDQDPGKEVYVRLPATSGWADTLEVRAGDSVLIRVVGGNWGAWGGPGGVMNRATGVGFQDEFRDESFVPGAQVGALVGRLAGGQPFLVGDGVAIVADRDGMLQLRINDYYPGDNSGWLLVWVAVE